MGFANVAGDVYHEISTFNKVLYRGIRSTFYPPSLQSPTRKHNCKKTDNRPETFTYI
jgi:hypothetical protein